MTIRCPVCGDDPRKRPACANCGAIGFVAIEPAAARSQRPLPGETASQWFERQRRRIVRGRGRGRR